MKTIPLTQGKVAMVDDDKFEQLSSLNSRRICQNQLCRQSTANPENMSKSKFNRIFFAADKGGSGSAVLDGPIVTAPPVPVIPASPNAKEPDAKTASAEPAPEKSKSELDDFVNPSLDELDGPIMPPEKKVEDKKSDPKKPDAKKNAEDDTNAPAKLLRERLDVVKKEKEATTKELAELRTQFEAHPKVKELDEVVKTRETELATLKAENDEMRRQLTMHDPAASEKVQTLVKQFDQEFASAIEAVPALEGQYRSLLGEFMNLPRDDRAKYQEALTEFEARVEEVVGERKTEAALALLRRGHRFVQESAAARKEVSENGSKYISEARMKEYDGGVKILSEHLAGAFEVDDTFADAQPFHPLNFVRNARAGLEGEAKVKDQDYEKKLDDYFRFASNGPSPKVLAELDALPASERNAKLAGITAARMEAAKVIRQRAKRSFYYEPYLESVLKDNASLREQLQKYAAAAPTDPTKRVGESGASSDNLDNFEAPRAELSKL